MASGWAQYAQMVKKCNTQIWGAGIFGHDGTLWGQDGLPLTTAAQIAQAKKQIALFCSLCQEDVDTSHTIFQSGFDIFDKTWAVVRIEPNMVVSKGKPPNTAQFAARKTGRCMPRGPKVLPLSLALTLLSRPEVSPRLPPPASSL